MRIFCYKVPAWHVNSYCIIWGWTHIIYCKPQCNTKNVYKWIINFISRKGIYWNNIKCSIKIGEQRKKGRKNTKENWKEWIENSYKDGKSIITLNVNCLNIPVEGRGCQNGVFKKEQDQSICRVQKTHFNYKDSNHWKVKLKKIISCQH